MNEWRGSKKTLSLSDSIHGVARETDLNDIT